MNDHNYRFSRPITALLVLVGPVLAPLAILGMIIRNCAVAALEFLKELPSGIAMLHREAVAALRWSIVDPASMKIAQVRAKIAQVRESFAGRREYTRMFLASATNELRWLARDTKSAGEDPVAALRNIRLAATMFVTGRPR
jgi:hypothetical protein